MAKLAFCDYHNIVAILEKIELNADFHQIVDFLKVSHIRQRTITKSSIRRHLKLKMMKCLSPKSTGFDEFSSNIATAIFNVPSPGVHETASPKGNDRYGEAFPTTTSLDAGLQRQHLLMEERVQSHDLEINQLKSRVKTLKENEKRREGFAQEDASNTRGIDQGEDLLVEDTMKDSDKSADKGSGNTDVMANVLGTLGAANVLAGGGLKAKFAQKDQLVREQAERDDEIARVHAERELGMMIAEHDRSNEMVAKYLSEYEQAEAELSHNEKVELIDELLMVGQAPKAYPYFFSMLNEFDREDVVTLWKLVKDRFKTELPKSNLEKCLFWPLKVMFEPVASDGLWLYQAPIKYWKLYSSCRVHCLSMEGMFIYMLDNVKYPLPKSTLQRMLNHK
ncbi:hypothetical protein Tco_1039505 [Tanacetum coccineum]